MPEKRINILIIAKYFPPLASVATQRIHAIAKYLDKTRFQVHILTPFIQGSEAIDAEMRQQDIFVHRVQSSEIIGPAEFTGREIFFTHKLKALWNKLFYSLSVDPNRFFTKAAVTQGQRLIPQEKIDIVFSSYAPISCLIVSTKLKKMFPQLIHVCDFRDEINYGSNFLGFAQKKLKTLEKEILQFADLVTSVSEPILHDLRSKSTAPQQFLEINNGYDFSELLEAEEKHEKLRLVYIGTFYGNRTPDIFFQALLALKKNNALPSLKFTVYGPSSHISIPSELKDLVETHQKVPYAEIKNILSQASAFLLVLPTGKVKGVFSGKIFDYLAINRPILALVDPTDVAAQLILDTQSGYIAAFDSIAETQTALLTLIKDWQKKSLPKKNWNKIYHYRRSNQVKILESHLLALYKETSRALSTSS